MRTIGWQNRDKPAQAKHRQSERRCSLPVYTVKELNRAGINGDAPGDIGGIGRDKVGDDHVGRRECAGIGVLQGVG